MALEVNGKQLDLTLDEEGKSLDGKNPYVKYYYECIGRLHKIFNKNVKLLLNANIHSKFDSYNNVTEYGTVMWNYAETIQRRGASETWKYYDTKKEAIGKTPAVYERKSKYIRGEGIRFNGDNANWEQCFFMIFISPNCEKMEKLEDIQNPKQHVRKDWFVDNLQARINLETRRNEMIGDVARFLYREADDETIRSMAGYGDLNIADSTKKDIKQLKNEVYNKIIKDPNLLEGFNPGKYNKETQKLRVLLNGMIDEGLLTYNKAFKKYEYKDAVTDVKAVVAYKVPKEVPNNMNDISAAFIKHVRNNPDLELKFEKIYDYHIAQKNTE